MTPHHQRHHKHCIRAWAKQSYLAIGNRYMHIILKEHWQGLSPPKVWIFIKIIHTTPAISESVMRILKLWKNRGDPYVHKIYIQWLENYQHWLQFLHMLATIVPFYIRDTAYLLELLSSHGPPRKDVIPVIIQRWFSASQPFGVPGVIPD
jgi:hypothetical protein